MATPLMVHSNLQEIPPVEEGTQWVWLAEMHCRSGQILKRGSLATVLKKTEATPYNEIMARGYNLLVETNGQTTVWATFEQCVSRNLLAEI